MEEVKESEFKLPTKNTKVILKHIPRKSGMASDVPENHIIAGGLMDRAQRKYVAPLKKQGGIANVLTKEEKDYLEKETGLNLSVYGDFWTTFSVTLMKDSANNIFDISKPMDYLKIKLLESLKDQIAPSWKERNNKLTYEFVITQGDEEAKEKKKSYDSKKEAFKKYGRIEDDRDKLVGILKLLTNKPISRESSLDWIQGQVEEYIDTMPTAFLKVIEDSSFETKALINKGIEVGVIVKNGNKYGTVDGLELSEADELATFDNAVKYLENPKYQEVRDLVEAKINNAQ